MQGLGENRSAAPRPAATRRRTGPRAGRQAAASASPLDLHNAFGAAFLGPRVPEVEAASAGPAAVDDARLRARLTDRFVFAEGVVLRADFRVLLAGALSAAKNVTGRDTAWFCDVAARLDVARATNLIEAAPGGVAALVVDTLEAPPTVLADLRYLADRHGAALIFDDSRAAIRAHPGGGQALSGVEPDLALVGAVIANSRPIAAAAGRARWLQAVPPGERPDAATVAVACAALDLAERLDAAAALRVVGAEIVAELEASLRRTGADHLFQVAGDPTWSRLAPRADAPGDATALSAFVAAELKRAGVHCPDGFIPACSTREAEVSRLVQACDRALARTVDAHAAGRFERRAKARRVG